MESPLFQRGSEERSEIYSFEFLGGKRAKSPQKYLALAGRKVMHVEKIAEILFRAKGRNQNMLMSRGVLCGPLSGGVGYATTK